MITPFQKALRDKIVPPGEIRQVTRCSRTTLWRWQTGVSFPEKPQAETLIALFSEHGAALDYNGIYQATVPVQEDARHG